MKVFEVLEAVNWRGSAVRGAAAVVFGILAVGVTEIVLAVRHRTGEARDWFVGLGGVLSITLAIVLVADPGRGVLTITWAIAWFAIITGVVSLVRAWRMRSEHPQPEAPRATPRQGAVA
jgi:uncharacterized membrane protein HdeD (DUF308 family)